MSKLIDLSERVDELVHPFDEDASYNANCFVLTDKYNDFLKTELLSNYFVDGVEYHFINRFVPCDMEGNVFTSPKDMLWPAAMSYAKRIEEYEKTYLDHLSKVWFEGFELMANTKYYFLLWNKEKDVSITLKTLDQSKYKSISDLTPLNLTLTPFGAKQAGL